MFNENENQTLSQFHIAEGHKVLDKKYWEQWDEFFLPSCDVFFAKELKSSLDIIKMLNDGCQMETVYQLFEIQSHSALPSRFVLSMVEGLCDRGREFTEHVAEYQNTKEDIQER